MATKQQIIDYLKANPNLSDAELVSYMAQMALVAVLSLNIKEKSWQ